MRNRYADGNRTAFDVVSGQSVDRVNVSADQSHDLGNGWGMTYGGIFSWAGDHDYQRYRLHEGDIATVDTDSHLDEYTGNLYAGVSKQFARGVSRCRWPGNTTARGTTTTGRSTRRRPCS